MRSMPHLARLLATLFVLALGPACSEQVPKSSNAGEVADWESGHGSDFAPGVAGSTAVSSKGPVEPEPRSLYPLGFGGLEDLSVDESVKLLKGLDYGGVAVEARGAAALDRLTKYLRWSEGRVGDFDVVAAFLAHRFDRYGLSGAGHMAAIDRLAGTGADLWVYFRDDDGTVTQGELTSLVQSILDYAIAKEVRVVLYPHYNNVYPTAEDALALVEEIDHPSFGLAVNLTHELQSQRGDRLARTFSSAEHRIFAVIVSGADKALNTSSNAARLGSTIMSLDEGEYDLRPFMKLIASSGYKGPIGFLNFKLSNPEDYLVRTIERWNELCMEVGLYNDLD